MKKIAFSFLLVMWVFLSFAQEPLQLNDTTDRFIWTEKYVRVYSSISKEPGFDKILQIHRSGLFKQAAPGQIHFSRIKNSFWTHIKVENKSINKTSWCLELYDFHINNYDIYLLHKDSIINHFSGGDSFRFSERKIKHKNFIHAVILQPGETYEVFIGVKGDQAGSVIGTIRSFDSLLQYSNNEYLLLAVFYGMISLLCIYSLFIYLSTRNRMYFYFCGYTFSLDLCSLSNDGLGYQFIWGNYPVFNHYAQAIYILLFIVFSLLYSSAFLQIKKLSFFLYKTIIGLVLIRTTVFIVGYLFYKPIIYLYQFDIFIMAYIFFLSIYSYNKGYKAARFFILAYSAFFIGFTSNLLMILGLIPGNVLNVYGMNIGATVQLMLLALAVADRIRIIGKESEDAQQEIIIQLKEKEALKDKVTSELEEKVKERTKELEYKNQQLDAFVYKASHDIKGPLRSILGLAKLGLLDVKDTNAHEYFQHIEKSSLRLDSLVNDLLQIAKLKNRQISFSLIDFQKVLEDVKDSFINIPDFKEFEIEVSIKQDRDFYSDEKMIYSIFQNLIENAFKYRDSAKPKNHLMVRIEIDRQKSVIEFADNGLGINKDLKDKIFDMFFRASDVSAGTGLGLYLVKMAVEKIGGRIQVDTELNTGSVFKIVI